jgi:hypothetical protein
VAKYALGRQKTKQERRGKKPRKATLHKGKVAKYALRRQQKKKASHILAWRGAWETQEKEGNQPKKATFPFYALNYAKTEEKKATLPKGKMAMYALNSARTGERREKKKKKKKKPLSPRGKWRSMH